MPIDTDQAESPGWWLKILANELHNRRVGRTMSGRRWERDNVYSSRLRPGLDLLELYRRGDPPLREDIHAGWAAPFRRYVRMGRLNFAGKLVRPTANRLNLRGFRTAAADDELGDQIAHELMRVNNLKVVARDVTDDFLSYADGYVLVTPPGRGDDETHSLITSQSPMQCITADDPATGRPLAGLNMFRDDWDSRDWAYLYLRPGPGETNGRLRVASKKGPTSIGHREGRFDLGSSWEWEEDKFERIPGRRLPLVHFRNERGIGEFEEHLDHLDRINDKIFNEWWIEKVQAFRQRAIQRDKNDDEGYEEDQEGEDGRDLDSLTPALSPQEIADMFVSSPDALWDLPPGAKMWESSAINVEPLLSSIHKELQWLAAAADKPLSSLTPDAANQSAVGSNNQKEEHLYLVEDRRDRAGGRWAEVISLAFEYQGDRQRADVSKIETLWGPIERFTLEQRAQADSQAKSLPTEARLRDIWQYDPAEIPDLMTMRGKDLIFQQPGQAPRSGLTP